MFIHGGGFKGIKHKPEIVEMANYFASRGWVFISIDYRTAEELGKIKDNSQENIIAYYKGIAPKEWVENTFEEQKLKRKFNKLLQCTAQRF